MKIYLQRHTQPNVDSNLCYGVSDLDLHTDFEALHLPTVLERLYGVGFSQIYSSPLRRCHRLAQRIKERAGISGIIVDRRLKELNFGDWELMPWSDINNITEGKEWFADFVNYRIPNGEAFTNLLSRAESFVEDVRPLNGDIMVVTHSGFMRAVMVVTGRIALEEAFTVEIGYGDLIEIEI